MSKTNIIDEIFEAFQNYGEQLYEGGEHVTQQQHALQTAHAAEKDGASDTLIAAAILHDYGHLVHDIPQEVVARGIDDKHEELVAALPRAIFCFGGYGACATPCACKTISLCGGAELF